MTKRLFVGCSFLCDIFESDQKTKLIGMPGAGNQAIAAVVLDEISKQNYDQVYVFWSGVNRIDIPIGLELHETFNSSYRFCRQLNDTVWYFSGGVDMSGSKNGCPRDIRKVFKSFYLGATPRYLTDLTLSGIVAVQSALETKTIDYRMSFIYDITADTQEIIWLNQVLGVLDQTSNLRKLVNWDRIQIKNTPFEWCQERNLLENDQFHPTKHGMRQWILENFDLDISKSID